MSTKSILEDVYWTFDSKTPVAGEVHPLPCTTGVLVVGGGYTGLCAALTLVRHGGNVAVCNQGKPGINPALTIQGNLAIT